MFLRCTQKFLKELRLDKKEITRYPRADHPLDEWYAQVFTLYPRRKCVVFAHTGTMFSFFALDIKRGDLANLGILFNSRLSKALYDENFPQAAINVFNKHAKAIHVTLTIDRVMIGTINRLVLDLQYFGDESERTMYRNEAVMGAHFRRGAYLAYPGSPVNNIRNMLLRLEEFRGIDIPEPLTAEMIANRLKVESIHF